MPAGLQTFGPTGTIELDTSMRLGRVMGIVTLTDNMHSKVRVPRQTGEQVWWYAQCTGRFGCICGLVTDDGLYWDPTNNLLLIQEGNGTNVPEGKPGSGYIIYGVS